MRKLLNIISEGVSDILYHKTHFHDAYEILKTDKFKLSTPVGSSADAKGDKLYFFSTARNLSSSYFTVGDYTVIFKLDGRKLGANHKGMPVDYWGARSTGKAAEEEDRIVTDSPFIENATKYIDELHILLPHTFEKEFNYMDERELAMKLGREPTDKELNDHRGKRLLGKIDNDYSSILRKVIILCKKNNIEFFAYISEKDMKYMQTSKALNLTDIDLDGKRDNDSYYSRKRRGYVEDVLELYYNPNNESKLTKPAKKYKDNLVRYLYGVESVEDFKKEIYAMDIFRSLDADIHNNRSSGLKSIERISKLTRKHGGLKELLLFIYNKWKN